MGFHAAIIINNDALSAIKEDKSFGEKVYHAVLSYSVTKPNDPHRFVDSGPYISAAEVVDVQHASTPLNVYNLTEAEEISLLRRLANKHGFRLSAPNNPP